MSRFIATAAIALLLSTAPLRTASAATDNHSGAMMGMMGGSCSMMNMMHRGTGGPSAMDRGMMANHDDEIGAIMDDRLAYLKSELKIADGQLSAWNGYADALRSRVSVMQDMRQSMMGAMRQGGAIERMDARIHGMEAMLDVMKGVKPATVQLYAVLTAEQKTIADQLIGNDCGAM